MKKEITDKDIINREFWVKEIRNLSGNFEENTLLLENQLTNEINNNGISTLINHLRLCGNIPEEYGHDSSEEKLYSKYTDILLSLSFNYLGFQSIVIKERSDTADVEVFSKNFNFVADAKSFRLSRTAKNQKDFKVQAMDTWKRGKPFAIIVSPLYQLPNKSSQIYHQAITRNVCIFSYSHLIILLIYAGLESKNKAKQLRLKILKSLSFINPTKNAFDYWLLINSTMILYSNKIEKIWNVEKIASAEALEIGKNEALNFLAKEREKILKMSHKEAITELIKVYKIENKIKTISSISDNGLFKILK